MKDPNQYAVEFSGSKSTAGQQTRRLIQTQHSKEYVPQEDNDFCMFHESGVSNIPSLKPSEKKQRNMPGKERTINATKRNIPSIEPEMESVVSNLTVDSYVKETEISLDPSVSAGISTRQMRRKSISGNKQMSSKKTTTKVVRENEDHLNTKTATPTGALTGWSEMESIASNLTLDSRTTESKSSGRSPIRKRRPSRAARTSRDGIERNSIVDRVKNFISGGSGGVSATSSVSSRSRSLRRQSTQNDRMTMSTSSTGRARPRRHSHIETSYKNRMRDDDTTSDYGRRRASTTSIGSTSKPFRRHSDDSRSTASTGRARSQKKYGTSKGSVNTQKSTATVVGSWRPKHVSSREGSVRGNESTFSTRSTKRRKSTGGMERRSRRAGDNEKRIEKHRTNTDDDKAL